VAAALGDRVRACVALAGPFNFGDCWDQLPQLTRETFRVRSRAGSDAEAKQIASTLTLEGSADKITAPLLIVFGRQDRLIPWPHAERLRDTAGGEVELLMLEDANHGCADVAPWHRPYTADWLAARLTENATARSTQ
jgi:2,6-dihydroxypseudooxynicotine hydrolase